MIVVKKHRGSQSKHFTHVAQYGNRIVLGTSASNVLDRAWQTWGGDVPALVYT